jgi:hypothetical protein
MGSTLLYHVTSNIISGLTITKVVMLIVFMFVFHYYTIKYLLERCMLHPGIRGNTTQQRIVCRSTEEYLSGKALHT